LNYYNRLSVLLRETMTKVTAVPETIRERFEHVQARIGAAAERARRSAQELTLVAISKTQPAAALKLAVSLGVTNLGENRVQEAEPKIIEVGRNAARWHLVGHLQSNKARRAVQLFDVIHSLDSAALAQRLNRLCEEEQRNELPVLIQVDLAGEETKSGITEAEVQDLAELVQGCQRLKLAGLMILPPYFEIAEQARPFFRRLRELRGELKEKGYFEDESGELSMGMSHDFEVAIEEGATMLRIGTAIFGERE
jgi:PLP dependent protein